LVWRLTLVPAVLAACWASAAAGSAAPA